MKRFMFLVLLTGCGARIEEGPAPDAGAKGGSVADTGLSFAPSDTGTLAADASVTPPDDGPPTTPPKDGETGFVNLEACGSAPGVDKLIFNMMEPMAPLASGAIRVVAGGMSCSDAFNSAGTGEYAYGSKCGAVDRTKPIVVTVSLGVTSTSGKTLPSGTYTFRPTGVIGKVCGDVYVL